jgi:hypothetical protein
MHILYYNLSINITIHGLYEVSLQVLNNCSTATMSVSPHLKLFQFMLVLEAFQVLTVINYNCTVKDKF